MMIKFLEYVMAGVVADVLAIFVVLEFVRIPSINKWMHRHEDIYKDNNDL